LSFKCKIKSIQCHEISKFIQIMYYVLKHNDNFKLEERMDILGFIKKNYNLKIRHTHYRTFYSDIVQSPTKRVRPI